LVAALPAFFATRLRDAKHEIHTVLLVSSICLAPQQEGLKKQTALYACNKKRKKGCYILITIHQNSFHEFQGSFHTARQVAGEMFPVLLG